MAERSNEAVLRELIDTIELDCEFYGDARCTSHLHDRPSKWCLPCSCVEEVGRAVAALDALVAERDSLLGDRLVKTPVAICTRCWAVNHDTDLNSWRCTPDQKTWQHHCDDPRLQGAWFPAAVGIREVARLCRKRIEELEAEVSQPKGAEWRSAPPTEAEINAHKGPVGVRIHGRRRAHVYWFAREAELYAERMRGIGPAEYRLYDEEIDPVPWPEVSK